MADRGIRTALPTRTHGIDPRHTRARRAARDIPSESAASGCVTVSARVRRRASATPLSSDGLNMKPV
jgi:hypothetical protein